jgi:hypothetical protein
MEGEARKKPVVIQFFEWDGNNIKELIAWCESWNDEYDEHFFYCMNKYKLTVKTLEGSSYDVPNGYMIIRGVSGEYYPCESEIFHKTYEIIT